MKTKESVKDFAERIIASAKAEMMNKPPAKSLSPTEAMEAVQSRYETFLRDKKMYETMLGSRICSNVFLYNRFDNLHDVSNQIAHDLRILYSVWCDVSLNPDSQAPMSSFKSVYNRLCHNLKLCEKGLAEIPDLMRFG